MSAGIQKLIYNVVEYWGKLPDGWRYGSVTGVAVDSNDNLYVFNRGDHPIIVFNRKGNFLRSWGEGLMKRAHGITIGPDDSVWLTDDGMHTVRKFTPDGKLLITIGEPNKPSEPHSGRPFNRPTHVAICPKKGDLYISDGYGNSHIHKYDPHGRFLFSWGGPGTDPGCFNLPHNIVTDGEGLVYVADRENHRIQVFDSNGRYLNQLNNLHRPCGLHADRRNGGRLYVGELGTELTINASVPNVGFRVSILSLKGELFGRVGGRFRGEKLGEFCAPHGVAVDSFGDLYVGQVPYTHNDPLVNPLQKFVIKKG